MIEIIYTEPMRLAQQVIRRDQILLTDQLFDQ